MMAMELGMQTTETAAVTPSQSDSHTEAVTPVGSRSIWGEIELAESYLVCSMFEEAASSASSVLKRLCAEEYTDGSIEDIELNDMLESAGMVFVQSLQELGRTLEIMNELLQLYNSLTAIPVQVFLAGQCHIEEKTDMQEFQGRICVRTSEQDAITNAWIPHVAPLTTNHVSIASQNGAIRRK